MVPGSANRYPFASGHTTPISVTKNVENAVQTTGKPHDQGVTTKDSRSNFNIYARSTQTVHEGEHAEVPMTEDDGIKDNDYRAAYEQWRALQQVHSAILVSRATCHALPPQTLAMLSAQNNAKHHTNTASDRNRTAKASANKATKANGGTTSGRPSSRNTLFGALLSLLPSAPVDSGVIPSRRSRRRSYYEEVSTAETHYLHALRIHSSMLLTLLPSSSSDTASASAQYRSLPPPTRFATATRQQDHRLSGNGALEVQHDVIREAEVGEDEEDHGDLHEQDEEEDEEEEEGEDDDEDENEDEDADGEDQDHILTRKSRKWMTQIDTNVHHYQELSTKSNHFLPSRKYPLASTSTKSKKRPLQQQQTTSSASQKTQIPTSSQKISSSLKKDLNQDHRQSSQQRQQRQERATRREVQRVYHAVLVSYLRVVSDVSSHGTCTFADLLVVYRHFMHHLSSMSVIGPVSASAEARNSVNTDRKALSPASEVEDKVEDVWRLQCSWAHILAADYLQTTPTSPTGTSHNGNISVSMNTTLTVSMAADVLLHALSSLLLPSDPFHPSSEQMRTSNLSTRGNDVEDSVVLRLLRHVLCSAATTLRTAGSTTTNSTINSVALHDDRSRSRGFWCMKSAQTPSQLQQQVQLRIQRQEQGRIAHEKQVERLLLRHLHAAVLLPLLTQQQCQTFALLHAPPSVSAGASRYAVDMRLCVLVIFLTKLAALLVCIDRLLLPPSPRPLHTTRDPLYTLPRHVVVSGRPVRSSPCVRCIAPTTFLSSAATRQSAARPTNTIYHTKCTCSLSNRVK